MGTPEARAIFDRVRNVAIVGWRATPLPEDVREWHRLGQTMAKAYPTGSACVDIIARGTPSFSDEMRAEAARFASDPKIFGLGIAHVILIPGMGGTAIRTFISTILLVTRAPAPTRAFGDLQAAAEWLVPRLPGWTRGDLIEACDSLRQRLDALG